MSAQGIPQILPEAIRQAGFAPQSVKLLRHDKRGLAAWREGDDEFLSFSSVQSLRSTPFSRNLRYVAHFLPGPILSDGGFSATFIG